ncbi:hypothetical protein [Amycolatopsis sp. cmx-11-12]|uniref:hypothetical protein n=1 Tax=Amycolatopsis sp. cmx-11-12 TaxID=2785795 RepID=UPI0039170DB5
MPQPKGFSVEIDDLKTMATDDKGGTGMPSAENLVRTASTSMRDLYTSPVEAFGSEVDEATELGRNRNKLIALLIMGGVGISDSLDVAASRLKTIAEMYERVEREIVGK